MNLADKKCIPCEDKSIKPFSHDDAVAYMNQVPNWLLEPDAKKISRTVLFPDFAHALAFVNDVGNLAESQGHHPDIFIWYNKVRLDLWTHAIGGLCENDFIIAAKINALPHAK